MNPRDPKLELLVKSTDAEICCALCDPMSSVPHTIMKTRFRISNLCCSGEEKIVRYVLQDLHGIEEVSINIIGRYAVVKHCNMFCCAPAENIVKLLNDKQLGASIQEANTDDDNHHDDPEYANIAHAIVVILLFITAALFDLTSSLQSHYLAYISCTAIGLVPILYDAFLSLSRLSIDIHILMIVAVAGAVASQEYQDAALVVTLFVAAELIESEVMRRVRNAVKLGVGGMPKSAILLNGDSVLVDDLKIGDKIATRAGDMILADGEITNGTGVVDESALTGEAIPIQKSKGDKVISGTVVQNGYLEILVETDPRESTVRKLNEKVAEVQTDRGRFASLVDRFAGIWTPIILLAAISLTCIAGGATGEWHRWSHRSLVLLVLACPCAIVIAAPIPSVCTIATAARHGVLIKGSSVVENLGVVDRLATDKTGTLTRGYFSVTASLDVSHVDCDGDHAHGHDHGHDHSHGHDHGHSHDDDDEENSNPIALAAALESRSAHPLANAIVSYHCGCLAEFQGTLAEVKKIQVMDGVGMQGWVAVGDDWKHIVVGNERILKAHGGKLRPSKALQSKIDEFLESRKGELILFISIDDELKALLSLSDELRPDAVDMVARMHQLDFQVDMLTGDHWEVAKEICDTVSIPTANCHARLLPQEKLSWIHKTQIGCDDKLNSQGGVVMLGDGINDATALASARVGVAMGAGGSAMAVVAADVVILSNNLLRLPSAISICRKARRIIITNCLFAVGLKMIAIGLAISGMLSLWQAVLIDVGSLLVVVGNGSSLLWSSAFRDSDIPETAAHSHSHGSADHGHGHSSHDHAHDHNHGSSVEREYHPPSFLSFGQLPVSQKVSSSASAAYNPLVDRA